MKITNTPNFNKAIRKHKAFTAVLDQLGVIEVVEGDGKRPNALKRLFGPVPGSTYVADV
ncbi:MAG: hypothetical protein GXP05_03300 [Alphaproteobacteria bacterium]|nr:hypothetical protein [Alphaproteobacteria bacterium]